MAERERKFATQRGHGFDHGLGGEALRHPVVRGDPDADRRAGVEREDLAQHLAHEAQPIGRVAAVLVAAHVGCRRHELVQQVAVAQVHFETVEAGIEHAPRCVAKCRARGREVAPVHRVRHEGAGRPRDRRRPPGGGAPVLGAGLAAQVDDLGECVRACAVDRIGDARIGGHEPVRKTAQGQGAAGAGRMHAHRLDDDQPGAAARPRRVIGDMGVGRRVVLRVVGGMAGHEHAVAQGQRAQRKRRQQARKVFRPGCGIHGGTGLRCRAHVQMPR